MRACLFNLILYAKKQKRAAYLRSVAEKIINKFPSRVIFITIDDEAKTDELTTSVSVMTANEGENAIVCDRIDIDANAGSLKRVPFVIMPHILPDLPIYLVWGEDPCEEDSLSFELARFATRVIFDSESSVNLPAFSQTLLKRQLDNPFDIADLNWARIEGWRQLLATIFKSDEQLHMLKRATEIHIHYNTAASEHFCHPKIQAFYLQGWLSCQLGWKLESTSKEKGLSCFTYQKENTPVSVYLHPGEMSSIPAGRILSMEIITDDKKCFMFQRSAESPHEVSVKISSPEFCEIPFQIIFDRYESGQSLVKEVFHKGTSKHYTTLLEYLAKLGSEAICE